MKHLFFIHSSITYLMAKQVIKEENLEIIDCIFLFDRIKIYENQVIKQIQFPFETFPNDYFKVSLNPFNGRKKIKIIDGFISEITDNQLFIFYAPKAQANYFYLINGNKFCKGFYYIEEGFGVYNFKKWQNPKKEIVIRQFLYDLNFDFRVPSVKHFYDANHTKYLGCYALHESAYKGFGNKKILSLPFQVKPELAHYESIIVFSCEIEFGFMKAETYEYASKKIIEYLISLGQKQVHFKFHPGQKDLISKAILYKIFENYKNKITLIEIDSSIILEEIAVSSPEVSFYFCTSSIGMYAALANKKIYSYIEYVRELEPDFQITIELPEFYSQKLIKL